MKATPDSSAPMVLVVDDDELLRRLNAEVLARSGYRVDVAPAASRQGNCA
jgi:DNA-binding response OmpR family regulator